jgi:serine/threonine protein kinase
MTSLPIAKTYILLLLAGLDYLHTGCRVVHTGLYPGKTGPPKPSQKSANIATIRSQTREYHGYDRGGDFMNSQFDQLMHYKIDSTGRVYRCHNDFGPLRKIKSILPKIVDFGLATRLPDADDCGIYPIQPDHYRAPEVILGCGWRTSADIWNLGTLVRDT